MSFKNPDKLKKKKQSGKKVTAQPKRDTETVPSKKTKG
jgi:hypothetical protein